MDKITDYEHYLEENGTLTYSNVGTSMLPLLRQGRDLFTVTKKGAVRCKAGDVVLYRRPPNKYVLHRVIAVRKNDYVILGDNCVNKEYGITDKDIIGVMTGYVRGGKPHTVSDRSYRLYTWYIMHTIPLRITFKKTCAFLKRVIKRFIGR
ncbi:MAG: S24/S26 family peptidase [Ruminococcus sp.]|nr:S24/S26 family peptidase [Ruminococcus sp.]MBQ7071113.1 S24/S26 family peptidase [Ruminococcus sp.]